MRRLMMGMLLMAMSACGGMEQPEEGASLQTQEAGLCAEVVSDGWATCRRGMCTWPSTHPCAGRTCLDVDDCYVAFCADNTVQCGM